MAASTETAPRAIVKDALLDGFRFRLPGTSNPFFELHSGGKSAWYMDTYHALSASRPHKALGELAWQTLQEAGIDFDAIGGKTLGSLVLTYTTLFAATKSPTPTEESYVRFEEGSGKHWFTIDDDEGIALPPKPSDRIIVVENTTTTGAEMVDAIGQLAGVNCTNIVGAMSVFDRSDGAVAERFKDLGIAYTPLFSLKDFPVIANFVEATHAENPALYTA